MECLNCQLLFDGTYIVEYKAFNIILKLLRMLEKTTLEVKKAVATSYTNVLALKKM